MEILASNSKAQKPKPTCNGQGPSEGSPHRNSSHGKANMASCSLKLMSQKQNANSEEVFGASKILERGSFGCTWYTVAQEPHFCKPSYKSYGGSDVLETQ